MRKQLLAWLIAIIALTLVGYNSIYIRKLSEVKASAAAKYFNASVYARNYFDKRLIPSLDKAVPLPALFTAIEQQPDSAFEKYGHALGIGNIRYFLVQGRAKVASINPDDIELSLISDSNSVKLNIATVYVFGNSVRDGSGLIDINDFSNTMDFNNVSAEINKIIRNEVLPPFTGKVKQGDVINFTAALELNKAHVNINNLTLIPVRLQIAPGSM